MFWKENREALRRGQGASDSLLARLAASAAAEDVQLLGTPAGDYTLLYRDIPLHDAQGAEAEARRIAAAQCKPALDRVHLLLGLGLGYLLEAIYHRSPAMIVVYEPALPLLKLALENVDLRQYLQSGRVQVVDTREALLSVLFPHLAGDEMLDILVTPGYAALMAGEIPDLMGALLALVEERRRDYHTGRYFHAQWMRQFFENSVHFPRAVSASLVRERLRGRPALVIGRGPSLDEALDSLRATRNRMTLLAVGGALHRLQEAGITPDFALFYDANGMREQLHGLPADYLRQIHCLISPFSQACCFETPSAGHTLMFPRSGEAFADWWAAISGDGAPLLLEGGGTVALLALQAALAAQADPIALVGVDLAFPRGQVYAGGQALAVDAQNRLALSPHEQLFAQPEAMGEVRAQDGGVLPALKAYESFVRHFERLAVENARTPHPARLINASLGGAALAGFELSPLSALMAQLPDLPSLARTAPAPGPVATAERTTRLADGFRQLQSDIAEAVQLHQSPERAAELVAFLDARPLLSHALMFEMLDTRQRYNPVAQSEAEVAANRAELARNTENCLARLRELQGWVASAAEPFRPPSCARPLKGPTV